MRSLKEISHEHTLLMEVGNDCCSYAFFHKPSNRIDRLQLRSLNETAITEQLAEIIRYLKEVPVGDVVVCSAFPQALLVPNKFFKEDYSCLDLVYELPAQEYLHDSIAEWQMVNVYALPKALYDTIQAEYTNVQYYHAYTPTIKIFNGYVADNQLCIHFTSRYFRVLLKKDTAVQLAQTYYYKTPLDVVYYLLKICNEFGLAQQDVHLVLSGLVEKASKMFTDLEQYFTHVHFAHPSEIALPDNVHPHYFFTSLYNLASCVS